MADLKIPNLNRKSVKYIFKKKLTLRRKSRSKLLKEAVFMLSLSVLIIYINSLIPNKVLIFDNFFKNFNSLLDPLAELFSYIYEIGISIFIILSLGFSLILIFGSCLRIIKVSRRKSKNISFK